MVRILGPGASRRRRLSLLVAVFSAVALMGLILVPAQAAIDTSLFELDKNAGNDVTTFRDTGALDGGPNIKTGPLGVLNAAVTTSSTSIQVCQFQNDDGTYLPPTGETILIDAERIVVGGFAEASGGGCPSGSTKRNYTPLTRTSPAAHSNGENVTRLTFASVSGHDWDQVYAEWVADNNTKCADLGAVECTFVHDGRGESIFTQSKDYDEISNAGGATSFWKWRDQSVPDADELDDGFAVKYSNGSQNLFFGADRFATNGSKDAGFWFFHDDVGTNPAPASGDGTFHGLHTAPVDGSGNGFCEPAFGGTGGPSTTPNCTKYDTNDTGGDILILTTFTNGGAVTTIRIYEWFGPAGTTSALFLRASGSDCVPGPVGASCATVNDTTVESGKPIDGLWPYDGKGEPVDNEISAGGFLEGGVNLTDLGLEGCFSSFMATSRSSPSLTADPKDFILGRFEACESSLTTTPKDGTGNPLAADSDNDGLDEIQIGTGSAGVDVTDSADLSVTGTAFTGTLSFFICGPIATGTCDTPGGVPAGSSTVTASGTYSSESVNLTEVGRYCWRGFFDSGTEGVNDATDASEGECFEVLPVTPELATTAVEGTSGLSPTIVSGLADLNGDGVVDGDDDSNAFYGDTSIIDGALDCNAWTTENDGAAGDGTIDGSDNCTLVGYDGTTNGVTIAVVAGEFQTADGPLPTVFNAANPDNPDVGDSDFAWSTIFGRVDSNGENPEAITGDDCHVGIIGGANILGSTCGLSPTPPAAFNGLVDLNGDDTITTADDSCTGGCFFGHDVSSGLVVAGLVDFGQPVYDVAFLTGTANQPGSNGGFGGTYLSINATNGDPAVGTITFTLVGPGDCTTVATTEDVSVNGDGFYPTTGFTPGEPGDYHWQAVYDGSPPNTLGTSHNDGNDGNAACSDTGEDVTVRQIPTAIATDQSWYPNDTATVTAQSGNLVAGGTIKFRLFGPTEAFDSTPAMTGLENCQADDGTNSALGLVYKETSGALDGGASDTASTTNGSDPNTAFAVDGATSPTDTFYWRVIYTPAAGDTAHTGRISECVESFYITFTNDAGPGDVFP